MVENIRLSFQGIWSHKMRSFLTMLGIIIGIASIISIVSTIKGTNEQIKKNLIGSGNNLVKVQLYQNEWEYDPSYTGVPDGVPTVSPETLEELGNLDHVVSISAYNSRRDNGDTVFYKNTSAAGVTVKGVDNSYFETAGYQPDKGRVFLESDFSQFKNVAVVDKQVADNLFMGDSPLGKTIEIAGVPVVVVGVVKEKVTFEPVINSMEEYYTYRQSSGGNIFVPKTAWPNYFAFDDPENIVIRATDTENMASAGKAVADYLNTYVTNQEIKYKAEDLLQEAKKLQDLSNSTNQQLIWIASISLLVGGIGVMNIMLVSVTERTKEIGLKKAIGAKKKKILWQFLTEASVLTSIGGVLGILGGIGMSQVVSKLTGAPAAISIPSVVIAVVFSMVIGIVFGLIPSIKAANLNPIDALRHE